MQSNLLCRRLRCFPSLLLAFPVFADVRCSLRWLLTHHCWVFVLTSARALTACSAVADLQVEQKPLCCYKTSQPSVFPILTVFLCPAVLLPGFCSSVVSAHGGLTEASVQESPPPTGETMAQPQRKSRPGQCALLLELVMDKVFTVLISAPVGARDHDTVSPSCGLT